jgi:hypothetical protein
MDQLIEQNAAASQIAALEYVRKLPQDLIQSLDDDLETVRQAMLVESDHEYEVQESPYPDL